MFKEMKKCLKERVIFTYPNEKVVDVSIVKININEYLGYVTTVTNPNIITSYRYIVEYSDNQLYLFFDGKAIANFNYGYEYID